MLPTKCYAGASGKNTSNKKGENKMKKENIEKIYNKLIDEIEKKRCMMVVVPLIDISVIHVGI